MRIEIEYLFVAQAAIFLLAVMVARSGWHEGRLPVLAAAASTMLASGGIAVAASVNGMNDGSPAYYTFLEDIMMRYLAMPLAVILGVGLAGQVVTIVWCWWAGRKGGCRSTGILQAMFLFALVPGLLLQAFIAAVWR